MAKVSSKPSGEVCSEDGEMPALRMSESKAHSVWWLSSSSAKALTEARELRSIARPWMF